MGPEAVFTESPSGIAFGVSSDIQSCFGSGLNWSLERP